MPPYNRLSHPTMRFPQMSPGNIDTSFHAHCPLCGGTEWAFVRKFGTSEIDYEIRECTNRIPSARDPVVHGNCGFIHRLQGKDTPNEIISNKVNASQIQPTKHRLSGGRKREEIHAIVLALSANPGLASAIMEGYDIVPTAIRIFERIQEIE